MSIETKITCDGPNCGADLATTGNSIDYRIVLGNERLPSRGGAVTDMMIYPPIDGGTKHFCGPGCLRQWVMATIPENVRPSWKSRKAG